MRGTRSSGDAVRVPKRRVRGRFGPRRAAPSRLRRARQARRPAASPGGEPASVAHGMIVVLLALALVLLFALDALDAPH